MAANGSLTGLVTDDSGKPIANARVLISYAAPIMPHVTAPPVITGALAATAATDASGKFYADNLAPGQYVVCAETTTPGYLDPCHWGIAAPIFTVTAGEAISGLRIVTPKGAVLRVHIDDPHQLLNSAIDTVDLDLEIHVVNGKGLHYSAPLQSRNSTGRDHAITIPFSTPVSLRVLSAHLSVADQSGKSFAALEINVPTGTAPPAVGLTVTGKK